MRTIVRNANVEPRPFGRHDIADVVAERLLLLQPLDLLDESLELIPPKAGGRPSSRLPLTAVSDVAAVATVTPSVHATSRSGKKDGSGSGQSARRHPQR
jgi:hypothetical protein